VTARLYAVTTYVRERRYYVIEAHSRDEAEELALGGDVEPQRVEVEDSFVHECRDITAEEKSIREGEAAMQEGRQ